MCVRVCVRLCVCGIQVGRNSPISTAVTKAAKNKGAHLLDPRLDCAPEDAGQVEGDAGDQDEDGEDAGAVDAAGFQRHGGTSLEGG